eukprot:TRINITY_DN112647_c0_g1_i1.p1 TRINITY_DN112647_c0_g1~~TRINITY_DN112647_c0_g1_i1.p1  ORF type:complete len:308 (+),score=50.92 TRINITY_DN112647_c0_g1_i1:270-1193(+)
MAPLSEQSCARRGFASATALASIAISASVASRSHDLSFPTFASAPAGLGTRGNWRAERSFAAADRPNPTASSSGSSGVNRAIVAVGTAITSVVANLVLRSSSQSAMKRRSSTNQAAAATSSQSSASFAFSGNGKDGLQTLRASDMSRQRGAVIMHALVPQKPNQWAHHKKRLPTVKTPRLPDDEYIAKKPTFAKYALQAVELSWVTNRQLEDARRVIVDEMGRRGKVYIRVYPSNAITARLAESRMGASQGKYESWVAALKPNVILFEADAETEDIARHALKQGSKRLPIKCRFVVKEDGPSMFELE